MLSGYFVIDNKFCCVVMFHVFFMMCNRLDFIHNKHKLLTKLAVYNKSLKMIIILFCVHTSLINFL